MVDLPRIRYSEDEEEAGNQPTALHALPDRSNEMPVLLVVGGDESVGRYFPIEDGMIIGRNVDADVVLYEKGVSRRHARVSKLPDGTFYFEDVGSSNGIGFNGARVVSQVVREGARVEIGEATLIPLNIKNVGPSFQKNLFRSATEDPTTRLTHRGFWNSTGERECSLAARYGVPLSLSLLAIDQYYPLLRARGEDVGDVLVKSVGHIITRRAVRGLLVCRHAADQLAVLLPETNREAAAAWTTSIMAAAAAVKFEFTSDSLAITLSGGISSMGEESVTSLMTLTTLAETRLARSKATGGSMLTA